MLSLSKVILYLLVRTFWKLLAESKSGDDLGEQSAADSPLSLQVTYSAAVIDGLIHFGKHKAHSILYSGDQNCSHFRYCAYNSFC